MVLEELVSILGFKLEGVANVKRYLSLLGTVAKRVAQIAAGLAAMAVAGAAAAFKLTRSVTDPLDAMIKLSARTGTNIETLQEWKHAAEESGTTLEALGRSIEQVNSRLEMATRGQGRAKEVIEKYSLALEDANGSAIRGTEFMEQLADVFTRISAAEQADIAKQLGITPSVVNLLQAGKEGIAAMREEARLYGLVLSEEALKDVEAFNDQTDLMGKALDVIRQRLALGLVPHMLKATETMLDWIRVNQEWIKASTSFAATKLVEGFLALIRILRVGIKLLGRLSDSFLTVFESITGSSATAKVALGVFAEGILLAFAPATAVVLGILLVLDDLAAWFEGAPSITGDAIEAMSEPLKTFEGYVNTYLFGPLNTFIDAIDAIGFVVGDTFSTAGEVISDFGTLASSVASSITGFFVDGFNSIVNAVNSAVDIVKEKFGELKDFFANFSISVPGMETLKNLGSGAAEFFGFGGEGTNTGVDASEVNNTQNNVDVANRTEINTKVDVTLPEGAGTLASLPGQIANQVAGVNEANNQSINAHADAIGAD